ncbi:hypothetical protein EHO60_12735 [Leptospira fletcheri]|uniref:Uncharacterized protein n=1 Tax=Leptospira fletcheri TaxID=2484981 RepID=A0A4R9GAV8_9LEPT|nr:hypothetical protein [Leptospira fletcheri]TGK08896.1 hypothetical protein EHO60_12735 [Leptospira fletcheri]
MKNPTISIVHFRSYPLVILAGFLLSFCTNTNDKSSKRNADPGLILQSLLQNSPDPSSECVRSYRAEEACLKQTADLPQIDEPGLSEILSGNKTSTYSGYCSSLLSSESFTKLNPKAQECVFSCNESYWSELRSANRCTGQSSDLISGSGSDSLSCIRNCSSISSGL